MIIKVNVDLSQYTTIRIGGKCRELLFPETKEELVSIIEKYPNILVFGGGSNLLINDRKEFERVVCLRNYEKNNLSIDAECVYVSAGVRLQRLISEINNHGYGGIEYLYSVPGLVGGAIFMNAGRGAGKNKSISDYLISVKVLEDGQIKTYSKKECQFSYRHSIFQNKKNCIILSAKFKFEQVSQEEGKKRQQERMDFSREYQDHAYPNLGTTFSKSNRWIIKLFFNFASKSTSGVHYSRKCENWLQNRGDGTFNEAIRIINRVKKVHRLLGKDCKCEYKIWY